MRIVNTIYSMLFNRCPRCHQGPVFKSANPYALGQMFELHETCSCCQLKYQKEPSFFYGAMYVSYALTSGWFIVWYVLYLTVLQNLDTMTFALMMAGSVILLSPLTLRWSRLIWLNFFFKYQKHVSTLKPEPLNNVHHD